MDLILSILAVVFVLAVVAAIAIGRAESEAPPVTPDPLDAERASLAAEERREADIRERMGRAYPSGALADRLHGGRRARAQAGDGAGLPYTHRGGGAWLRG